MRKATTSLLILSVMTVTSVASAHITLTSPPARHPASDLKYGPCGVESGDARSTDPTKITTFTAGETITVIWTEVIDHDPSHYRIAFSREGDTFADPLGFDDVETVYPELLDGIPDADAGSGHEYSVEITLPNEPCDRCSLQLIQVMHDKPPWGPGGGDDIYYQCADIILLEDPNDPPIDDPPPTGVGGTPLVEGTGGMDSGSGGQPVAPAAGGTLGSGGTPVGAGGTETAPPASGGAPSGNGADQPGVTPGTRDTDDSEDTTGGCHFDPNAPRHPLFALVLLALGLGARRRSATARLR